jgi:cobalt-zinc-cadmium efflux system outer membrane protein
LLWQVLLITAIAGAVSSKALSAQSTQGDAKAEIRLTLTEARERADTANKQLAAARLDTAIAKGELRQRGVFQFNPTADVLGPFDSESAEFGVSQELEVAGQRGYRVASGRANLDRSRAASRNAARTTIGAIDRSFYRLASATERTKLSEDVLILSQRLASITERQLAAGEVSRLDYNLAVIELGRSRSRLLATQRQREQASVELARLLGMNDRVMIVPVIENLEGDDTPEVGNAVPIGSHPHAARAATLNLDSLVSLALATRPDLTARDASLRQAQAELGLSRRSALPNLMMRAMSEPGASSRIIRGGLGLSLPIFNRNQGEVDARQASVSQARLESLALIAHVKSEVASELAAYQAAAEQVEILETTVLIPARQNRQLLETAYREGKVGLSVLLLIRNQVIDAEVEYWEAWLAEREALANLREATGENYPLRLGGRR